MGRILIMAGTAVIALVRYLSEHDAAMHGAVAQKGVLSVAG